MERIDISVLMAVYKKDNPAFLRESLESIFTQTVEAGEVVLLEDGPLTEALYDVIKLYQSKYPALRVVAYSVNRGLGKTLNDGLQLCKYDIVARMDADDICKSNRFETEYKWLKTHEDYDVIGSWVDEFTKDKTQVRSIRKVPEQYEDIKKYARYRCPVNHPTVMYRKAAVQAVGGYLTEYFPEDYFLWLRMLKNGCKFYNIQQSLLWFRYSEETVAKRGGWSYACDEVRILVRMLKMGYIPFHIFCQSVVIRFTTRVMPLPIRQRLYNLIRKT